MYILTNKLKNQISIALVVVALTAVFASAICNAAGVLDTQDVVEQIEAVRQRLEQVRTMVEQSGNERAISQLDQGSRFLDDAEKALERPNNELQARNFVRRALELVNGAAYEVSRGLSVSQEQAERELEHLREVIRTAASTLFIVDVPAAESLFRRAEQEAESARVLYEKRAYTQCLDKVRRAVDLAEQSRRLAGQNAVTPVDDTIASTLIQDLNDMIEQARLSISDTSIITNAAKIIDNAESLSKRAENSFGNGHVNQGLEQARRAREILQLVLNASSVTEANTDAVERANRELDRVKDMLQEAEKALVQLGDSVSAASYNNMLLNVQGLIEAAEAAVENGEMNKAMNLLAQGVDSSVQLIFMVDNSNASTLPTHAEAARNEYGKLVKEIIPGAYEQVVLHPNAKAVRYLEQAQSAAEQAEKHISNERFEQALQQIDLSKSLARKAVDESRRPQPGQGVDSIE